MEEGKYTAMGMCLGSWAVSLAGQKNNGATFLAVHDSKTARRVAYENPKNGPLGTTFCTTTYALSSLGSASNRHMVAYVIGKQVSMPQQSGLWQPRTGPWAGLSAVSSNASLNPTRVDYARAQYRQDSRFYSATPVHNTTG